MLCNKLKAAAAFLIIFIIENASSSADVAVTESGKIFLIENSYEVQYLTQLLFDRFYVATYICSTLGLRRCMNAPNAT